MANKKINLVAADMGYGHQRAAYPLLDLSAGEIITLNDYAGILEWEKKYWINSLRSYEQISRFKKIPLLGSLVFAVMDAFQKIQPLYPFRDLSKPTTQQKYFYKFIKKGLGLALVQRLNKSGLPYVTTFFVAAYVAEYHNYQGDIYCIICDTDASRAWAPLEPKNSRIKFLVPSEKVRERFLMYGVRSENIIITGFPLPKENIGPKKELAALDLARRIINLDPEGNYRSHYESLLKDLVPGVMDNLAPSPVTITFAVGGAGAQKEIGVMIMNKLAKQLKVGEMRLNLVAGNRLEVKDYFIEEIRKAGLSNRVPVIFAPDKLEYFKLFNQVLRSTDILWTKPSELSFYCALGLPIMISPPVGSQEDFNREWLLSNGAGIDSLLPAYIDEWLPELLRSGRLARAAMDGFLNAEQLGAYNIEAVVLKK